MFLLLTVLAILFYELTVVYDVNPSTSSNAVNEKWGLLYASVNDRVFADNYRYHVDASDYENLRLSNDSISSA